MDFFSLTFGRSYLNLKMLAVIRKSFLISVVLSFSLISTSLWAVARNPALLGLRPLSAISPPPSLFPDRPYVRRELEWFFKLYPYISLDCRIESKSHHKFLVHDPPRVRSYLIMVKQRERRVEIYGRGDRSVVHVYTPGFKREVQFEGERVLGESRRPHPNAWMWEKPLWNAAHWEVVSLAGAWQDAPYRKHSCAGFVHEFLTQSGIPLERMDAWDYARQNWQGVSREELEPGDLLTFYAPTPEHRAAWGHRITHVGIYIGDGRLIHAATPGLYAQRSHIVVSELNTYPLHLAKALRPPSLE